MSIQYQIVIDLLDSIKLDDPFQQPVSEDVISTVLKLTETYWLLSAEEKLKIVPTLTYNECRSLVARLYELCEMAINTGDDAYLQAGIVLYELGATQIEYMGLVVYLSVFNHSWIKLHGSESEFATSPMATLSKRFLDDYIKFGQTPDMMSINIYHLREAKKEDGSKFFEYVEQREL